MVLRNISNPAGSSLPDVRTIELKLADLDRMVRLEEATWPPGMLGPLLDHRPHRQYRAAKIRQLPGEVDRHGRLPFCTF